MMPLRIAPTLLTATLPLIAGSASPVFAQKPVFTFSADTSFALGRSPRIEIENQSGDVIVMPSDADQITVTVRRLIPASDSASAETFLDRSHVEYDVSGHRLRILASVGRSARERMSLGGLIGLHEQERGEIELELQVPETCDLEVFTASGDQSITGIEGNTRTQSASGNQNHRALGGRLRVASASGDITVSDCNAILDVDVSSGTITAENLIGDGTLRSTAGDIQLRNARGDYSLLTSTGRLSIDALEGSLNAQSSSGDVVVRNHKGSVDIRTGSGGIALDEFAGPAESANLRTGSGDVALRWPAGEGCAFEIISGSGTLSDDLGVSWETRSRRVKRGKFGDGRVPVRIETGNGDIQLRGLP